MTRKERAAAVDAAWAALEAAAIATVVRTVQDARRKCTKNGAGPRPMPVTQNVNIFVDVEAEPW